MMAGDFDIPLFVDLYQKDVDQSKIDLAIGQIHQLRQLSLPVTTTGVVVTYTWFSSKKLINDTLKQGFEVETILKSNKLIKPNGIDRWLSIRKISAN